MSAPANRPTYPCCSCWALSETPAPRRIDPACPAHGMPPRDRRATWERRK